MFMARTLTLIPLFVLTVALPLSISAAIVNFERNLRLGDSGPDVKALQVILNANPLTHVASSGPGSPGDESTYFGFLTKQALIRYQELHSQDILIPAGLASGTGYFGLLSRAFVNSLESSKSSGGSPVVLAVEPAVIERDGEEVIIRGGNFDSDNNTVFIAGESTDAFTNLSSLDGKTLRFVYTPSFIAVVREQLFKASVGRDYQTVVQAFGSNIQERLPGHDEALVALAAIVENSNGKSQTFNLIINLSALLLVQ